MAGCVVVIENCALDAPAAIKTVDGTAATAALELDTVTVTPPWGAKPVNETVPLTVEPPVINAGILMALSDGASTVICPFREVRAPVAV